MSNPNKHNPLSPEELFKLLDSKSNKASDFDELDDFEREALEGFSAHSDSEKAKALTEELNVEISKKIADSHKGGSKNKIIWFSAAASIVLVIMISVFFFNQSKEESQTNIALNEAKEEGKPAVTQTELPAPLEMNTEKANSNGVTPDLSKKELEMVKSVDAMAGPKKEGESIAGLTNESTIGYTENKPVLSPAVSGAKDEAKSRKENDYDDLQNQTLALADKIEVTEKLKTVNLEQENVAGDVTTITLKNAVNQNVNTVAADTKQAKEEYYKAEADKSVLRETAAKKSTEKQKLSKEQATSESYGAAGNTKADAAPAQGSTVDNNVAANTSSSNYRSNNTAYYTGSELAIRDVVLSYFKNKSLTTPALGKYKIKGVVDAKGKLKVSSVTKISKEDCKCSEDIEKALNSMKKWNAAIEGGKEVSSNVEFVLSF